MPTTDNSVTLRLWTNLSTMWETYTFWGLSISFQQQRCAGVITLSEFICLSLLYLVKAGEKKWGRCYFSYSGRTLTLHTQWNERQLLGFLCRCVTCTPLRRSDGSPRVNVELTYGVLSQKVSSHTVHKLQNHITWLGTSLG